MGVQSIFGLFLLLNNASCATYQIKCLIYIITFSIKIHTVHLILEYIACIIFGLWKESSNRSEIKSLDARQPRASSDSQTRLRSSKA
jgi:hypothetical protein